MIKTGAPEWHKRVTSWEIDQLGRRTTAGSASAATAGVNLDRNQDQGELSVHA
jgi:hypothetical protein